MSINFQEVTVVVQGPIDWSISAIYSRPTTLMLTRQIRKLMPGARIVLSTWIGQNVEGLSYDIVVLSKDPGPQGVWPSYTPNNVNRQILSTTQGLDVVQTEYVLKIRSDIILLSTKFMDVYALLPRLEVDDRAIFQYPILCNNLTSRHSRAVLERIPDNPLPLHPSDHVHFGRVGDLKCLWDVPLQTDEDAFYFMDRVQPNRWRAHELSRLAPEQHILSNAISKRRKISIRDFADGSDELLKDSDYYMSSHFYFMKDSKFSISFAKYHTDHHGQFEWMRHDHGLGTDKVPRSSLVQRVLALKSNFKLP